MKTSRWHKAIPFFRKIIIIGILSIFISADALAARLKDIASIRGVRENQLIGYGLVVGLQGTGDSGNEFTHQSIGRMLDKLGVKVEGADLASQNVAAVIVTATLPPFAKAGNSLDITVSSLGSASSLAGGMLLQTPLRAANEKVYAVAQGPLLLGSDGASHPTSGRIPNGALIERDVSSDFSSRNMFRLTLHNPDFTTAARVAMTINRELGGQYASARDAGTIDIITPFSFEGKGVELLATIEAIEVNPDQRARVVINEKTGTVIIGERVRISKVAISHGSLSVTVQGPDDDERDEKVFVMDSSANVGGLVQSLNKLGVTPKDLITILQSVKAAGALHGELEIL